jgi:hypothetical protein
MRIAWVAASTPPDEWRSRIGVVWHLAPGRRVLGYLSRHHVALLALFIALGATSYAAVKLPANSVGAKLLKPARFGILVDPIHSAVPVLRPPDDRVRFVLDEDDFIARPELL